MSHAPTPEARRDGDAWILPVYVQPGARRQRVVGVYGDAVKIAVNAPAEKGKANTAVRALIAREFGVRPAAVAIVSGATSRRKEVRVEGISADVVASFLGELPRPRG